MYVLYACIFSILFSIREKKTVITVIKDALSLFKRMNKYHDNQFIRNNVRLSNYITFGNIFFIFRIFQFFKFYKAKLSVAMSVVDRTTNICKGCFPTFTIQHVVINFCTFVIYNYIYTLNIYYICIENKENIWIRMQPAWLTYAWLKSHIHTCTYMRAWPRVWLWRVGCWLLVQQWSYINHYPRNNSLNTVTYVKLLAIILFVWGNS